MNNSNYSYPFSGYSSSYSSTPSNMRPQRPRFGYSGPSLYPRPRSSASKPNPNSFSDSMINNYGTSPSRIDTTFNSENNSFNNSYKNNSDSSYYTANESYYSDQQCGGTSLHNESLLQDDPSLMRGDPGLMRNDSFMYKDTYMMQGDNSLVRGGLQNSGILPKPPQFGQMQFPSNDSLEVKTGEFKGGNFQKKLAFGQNNKPSFSARKFGKAKNKKMDIQSGTWKCDLCSLDFTSQVPYDMHLRGARHAKKQKAKQALIVVQSQAQTGPNGVQIFVCEMCNVTANSSLQFQTHLEGNKHKNKLNPKEPKEERKDGTKDTTEPVNVKTNGSLVRSAPADFGEPQPAKLTKFACDICNVSVNSDLQLQQHLTSKKHQNKVEGKPAKERKNEKKKERPQNDSLPPNANSNEAASSEASKMVVGVKTLSSSFVQGETLK